MPSSNLSGIHFTNQSNSFLHSAAVERDLLWTDILNSLFLKPTTSGYVGNVDANIV